MVTMQADLKTEHHHGLMVCWNMLDGLKRGVEATRIKAYASWFYVNHLEDHFQIEERQLFPALGFDHPYIQQAIEEHQRLRLLFTFPEPLQQTLELISAELDHHIRFEERLVFPAIKARSSEHQWHLLEAIHREPGEVSEWSDPFWE